MIDRQMYPDAHNHVFLNENARKELFNRIRIENICPFLDTCLYLPYCIKLLRQQDGRGTRYTDLKAHLFPKVGSKRLYIFFQCRLDAFLISMYSVVFRRHEGQKSWTVGENAKHPVKKY